MTVNDKVVEDCQNWLSLHPVWGELPVEALQAIAQSFHCFGVEPQTLIYQEGQTPIGLYLLKSETVEIFQRIGQLLIRYRNAGNLFGHTLIANRNLSNQGDRPGRSEPQVRKRRPKAYPLMTKPRH